MSTQKTLSLLRRAEEIASDNSDLTRSWLYAVLFIGSIFFGVFLVYLFSRIPPFSSFPFIFFYVPLFLSSLFIVYRVVEQRNRHFKKSLEFYETVAEVFESLGVSSSVSRVLRSFLEDLRSVSRERNALRDALLSLTFFYMVYLVHTIQNDYYKHSSTEKKMLDIINFLLGGNAFSSVKDWFLIIGKSNLAIKILSIIPSLGLSVFYVVGTLSSFSNDHIKIQKKYDKALIEALKNLTSSSLRQFLVK